MMLQGSGVRTLHLPNLQNRTECGVVSGPQHHDDISVVLILKNSDTL